MPSNHLARMIVSLPPILPRATPTSCPPSPPHLRQYLLRTIRPAGTVLRPPFTLLRGRPPLKRCAPLLPETHQETESHDRAAQLTAIGAGGARIGHTAFEATLFCTPYLLLSTAFHCPERHCGRPDLHTHDRIFGFRIQQEERDEAAEPSGGSIMEHTARHRRPAFMRRVLHTQ